MGSVRRKEGYPMALRVLLVILISMPLLSAQITFNWQWTRGKYPKDGEEQGAQRGNRSEILRRSSGGNMELIPETEIITLPIIALCHRFRSFVRRSKVSPWLSKNFCKHCRCRLAEYP